MKLAAELDLYNRLPAKVIKSFKSAFKVFPAGEDLGEVT